ncbi:RNA-directed DNA polymerase, eukaryota [Tanacetum coccineum]
MLPLGFRLKGKFLKSKLSGTDVSDVELNAFASKLFCEPSKLPCVYIGLPIGAKMNKNNNWKPIIAKFHNRLTSWKAKSLSLGDRLILLKSILGALGTYYCSIFQAPKCVLTTLNNLDGISFRVALWRKTKLLGKRLYSLESNKQCLINDRCSLLNGSIHFTWAWRRNLRSGHELDQLDTLMGLLQHHFPCPIDDRWDFTLHHSNMYSESVLRKYIDSKSLLAEGNKTRWNKLVPTKINILAWRLINDRLPTRLNLASRGIDLHSLLCPVCDDNIESAQHLFVHCNLAIHVWS